MGISVQCYKASAEFKTDQASSWTRSARHAALTGLEQTQKGFPVLGAAVSGAWL